MLKLCVYIPASHLERVKEALFAAGAGRYQNYDRCSWETPGTGQFRPLEGSQPFIGTRNQVERVTEYRVEMVCAVRLRDTVAAALTAAHPYETPAFDFTRIEEIGQPDPEK